MNMMELLIASYMHAILEAEKMKSHVYIVLHFKQEY